MRILLVAYFFRPARNVASERWSRFADFLRSAGHEVEVISGPWASESSPGLAKVTYLSDPISDDAQRMKPSSSAPLKKPSLKNRVARILPSFLWIDGKWFWSLKAAREVARRIRSSHYDQPLVIVTGSPWSTLTAVSGICRWLRNPYVVDFRDLWSTEPYLRWKSRLARAYFSFWEKRAVQGAVLVLTVNSVMARYFESLAPKIPSLSLPNGYEGKIESSPELFNSLQGRKPQALYAGSIAEYHGMSGFIAELPESFHHRLVFLGKDHTGALSRAGLTCEAELPESQALERMQQSAILVMTLGEKAEHYVTGKLMTYLKATRPILYFGPPASPAAEIIRRHDLGWVVDRRNPAELSRLIPEIERHLNEAIPFDFKPDFDGLKGYSIPMIGARLVQSLEKIYDSKNQVSGPHTAS